MVEESQVMEKFKFVLHSNGIIVLSNGRVSSVWYAVSWSGLEESLLLQWPEGQHGELRELRMSEPQSYTYDWSRGLKDATTLYRWDQLLTLFTASHDRSQTSAMAEIHTLCAMPPTVLEQLIRALVLDMRSTDPSGGTPTTRNVAGEAATLALTEGLPTVRDTTQLLSICAVAMCRYTMMVPEVRDDGAGEQGAA